MQASNDLTIRMPGDLIKKVELEAEKQGVSMNEFAMYIIARELGSFQNNQQFLSRELISQVLQSEPERSYDAFKAEVKNLYEVAGYKITENQDNQNALTIDHKYCGVSNRYTVECRDCTIDLNDCGHLINMKHKDQTLGLIVVAQGFFPDALKILEEQDISCLTYRDLIFELFPLQDYVNQQIITYESKARTKWNGKDCFISPDIQTHGTLETHPGVSFFLKWLQSSQSQLIIFGDMGSGKTTFLEYLNYQMSRGFQNDPVKYPIPILIPLDQVADSASLADMIRDHFSNHGFVDIHLERFYHLLSMRRIILLFDGFEALSDRTPWKIPRNKYKMLQEATAKGARFVMTCRTHFFKNHAEMEQLVLNGYRSVDFESELLGANEDSSPKKPIEVILMKTLQDNQIQDYFKKLNDETADDDIEKMAQMHHLTELTHSPLFLDVISKQLQYIENSADMYSILTRITMAHLKSDRWFLDAANKKDLMLRLAWELWSQKNHEIHYKQFLPILLPIAQARNWSEKNIRTIIRELMTASFLKRDDQGNFSFMYPSLMQYFLAKRLHAAFKSTKAIGKLLKTHRFDNETVYYLWLLNKEKDDATPHLQNILKKHYKPLVSENALQILYWFSRYACNMPSQITNIKQMHQETARRIPEKANLANASLQEIILEAADLQQTDFQEADLTHANLRNALLDNANMENANLEWAIMEQTREPEPSTADEVVDEVVVETVEPSSVDDIADSLEIDDDDDEDWDDTEFDETPLEPELDSEPEPEPKEPAAEPESEPESEPDPEHKPDKTQLKPYVQSSHNYPVCSVTYNKKLNLLASSDTGGTILVYDATTKHVIHSLDGHQSAANTVLISSDGQYLASSSDDHTVCLWDIQKGELVHVLEGHQSIVGDISFSPDGKYIASCSEDETIRIWNIKDGHVVSVLKGHTSTVLSIDFSPNGLFIVSGSFDRTARLWEIQSGELVRTFEGHQRYVSAVSFAPDSLTFATGGNDQTVRLWHIQKGDSLHVFHGHSDTVGSVKFSPNGNMLASASHDQSIRLWNLKTKQPTHILKGHTDKVNDLVFLSNPKHIASASDDHTVKFWHIEKTEPIGTFEKFHNHISSVDFSPDNESIVNTNSDNTLSVWDILNGNPRVYYGHEDTINMVKYSPDNQLIASASNDQTIRIWDVQNNVSLHTLFGHSDGVTSVDFSSDGIFLASGSNDQTLRLWGVQKGDSVKALKGHTKGVLAVKFSPNGSILASGSHDKTVRLWDVQYARKIRKIRGHSNAVTSVDFSPDGQQLVSGSYDNTVRIWSTQKGKSIHVLKGHTHSVVSVAFSPDGKFVASASYDQTVRLWNVKTGECYKTMKGHNGGVYSIRYSPNGKYLVAAGTGGRLQFWDAFNGKTFLYRYYFAPDAWIDLMPEGRFNSSVEGMKYLRYTEIDQLKTYPAEFVADDFNIPDDVKSLMEMFNKGRE